MYRTVIIDDDPNLLEGMRYAIPWHELNLEWAGEGLDGKQGLDLIIRTNPDIVICDIDMPVMNGLEMIEMLRNQDYPGKIVILSGYSDFEYARTALRLSVQDYLSKPITIDSLKRVLLQVTDRLDQEQREQLAWERSETERLLSLDYTMNEWMKSLCLGDYTRDVPAIEGIQKKIADWEQQTHLIIGIELASLEASIMNPSNDSDAIPLTKKIREEISNVLEDASFQYEYIFMNSHQHAVLLHLQQPEYEDDQHAATMVQRVADQIQAGLRRNLGLAIKIGIGSLQTDWRRIYESFESAYSVILQDSATPVDEQRGQLRSIRFYHQFAQAIRNSHEGRIYSLIEEHLDASTEKGLIHVSEMLRFKREILAILTFTLYDNGIELDDLRLPTVPRPDRDIYYSSSVIHTWLNEVVESVVSVMNTNNNPRHRKIVDMIKKYTDQYYMEDLTLGYMAEYVQVSRNYLGQIFKSVMGETFNSYLTRVRMEKAKEMLISGNLYIYEVAEKVGYHSISYFSTQFKKYMGQNPTELN